MSKLPKAAQEPCGTAGWIWWRRSPPRPALWAWEAGTHARICLRAEGPGRSRRSLPGSTRSGHLSCCAGIAGSDQTGGHSCPQRWGPRFHCTDMAGRAGGPREPQWVPEKAIITDLTAPPWESRRLVWRSRNEGPGLLSPRAVRVGGNPRELPRGSWWSRAWAPGLG